MSVFKLEEEIWEVDGLRVFFSNPEKLPSNSLSYKALFPEPLSGENNLRELVERIITCVGHGVEFGLVDTELRQISTFNHYRVDPTDLN